MSRPYYKTDPITGGGPAQYISAEHKLSEPWKEQAHNVKLVGHSDLNGWGDAFQIQVSKGICYVAASGVNGHDGLTILDVSDPSKPTILNQISDSPGARTHKVLKINDDIMITNSELRPNLREKYPEKILIGDSKRADIGSTAQAYANSMYDYWGFDVATVNPFFGTDSIVPFSEKNGAIVICKSSNKSSHEIQNKISGDKYIYE